MHTYLRNLFLFAILASTGLMDRARAADPVLTIVAPIPGADEDQVDFPIAHSILLGLSDAADADFGDPNDIQFVIKGNPAGTLKDGSNTVVGDGAVLSKTEFWKWTPPQDQNGPLVAFSIRAFDGTNESATDVDVTVEVAAINDPPKLTAISVLNIANAKEDSIITFTHNDLLMAATVTDAENDPIDFIWKSDTTGTSTRGAGPGGDTLSSGETWTWAPDGDDFGELDGFEVVAYDGTDESSNQLVVKFQVAAVNDAPTFDFVNPPDGDVSVAEDAGAQTIPWATNISAGADNEEAPPEDQTVSFSIDPAYDTTLFTAGGQPMIDNSGTLTFTPEAHENGTTTLTVNAVDDGMTPNGGDDTGPDTPLEITITAVEDDPELGGALGQGGTVGGSNANPLSDAPTGGEGSPGTAYTVFDSITVTDVDDDKPDHESLDLVVTVPADIGDYGTFDFTGWTESPAGTFTKVGMRPSEAETALDAVTFTPDPNAQPVDIYALGVTITVEDKTPGTTPDTTTDSLHLQSINDPPTATASLTPDTVTDSGEWKPFRLTVDDPDPGDTFEVTVTETSGTSRGTLTLPSNPITGDAAGVNTAIRDVSFQPFQQSMLVDATFRIDVIDVHPDTTKETTPTSDNVTLSITFNNDAPQLSGITTELIRITDDPSNPPTMPFLTATISDADPGQTITVTLTLDDAAQGSLVGLFDVGVPGQISGTAAYVTDELRKVQFIPTAGRTRDGGSETVTINIRVDDGTSSLTNSQTQIEVTSVNGAPAVLWDSLAAGNSAGAFPLPETPALITPFPYVDPDLVANPNGDSVPAATPFDKVEISDDGEVVLTVSIDDVAKGTFRADTIAAFTENSPGSYSITGTPATVEAALQAIVFLPSQSYLFPPGQPGRTDFTISASDAALNVTTELLPIVLINDSRNFLVTSVLDDPTVSGTLRHALLHAKNDDVITFALPTYPAVIRLSALHGTLELDRHLTFLGPGSDMLTISGDTNANGLTDTSDLQVMRVLASVRVKGLTISSGFGASGGAAYVGRHDPATRPGELILEDCIISDCLASFWGGAIDVEEGSVRASRCLFEGNRLGVTTGLGGGAVSLWTDLTCEFDNCTFSGNSQGSPTGFGGGAIYAESYSASFPVPTKVNHCSFSENIDAAGKGSSVHSNVAHTQVVLTNSLFGDASAGNLYVAGSGEIQSSGGNLSDDNTSTTLIQDGVPSQNFLLDDPSDQRATPPELAPIGALEGPTRGYRLLASSPAIGMAVEGVLMLDQRGVIRSGGADAGAVDASALGKMLVHEVFASEADPTLEFIEFFNPRDQGAIDLSGYEIRVNGATRHTFTSSLMIQPGFGFILAADKAMVETDVPDTVKTPVLAGLTASDGGLGLTERGTVELFAPTQTGLRLVESVSYVAVFVNAADPTGLPLNYDSDSITLAPQAQGAALVPNSKLVAGPGGGVDLSKPGDGTSPGAFATGTPFGEDNAFPFAVADRLEINEDDFSLLDVLANDVDADGTDRLFIVDLDNVPTDPALAGNVGFLDPDDLADPADAPVKVLPDPNASPLRGTSLSYDPTVAFNHLPAGARVTDTFAYSIIDVGGGAVTAYADDGSGDTRVTAPAHRLDDGDEIEITGCSVAEYNVVRTITDVDEDHFTINIPFNSAGTAAIPPTGFGDWLATAQRMPSERSEALVEVIILGRNDNPMPVDDLVGTDEDSVLRIFGDRVFGDPVPALDTDALYPQPREVAEIGILRNDDDPDSNDKPFTQLKIVGVSPTREILAFAAGADPDSTAVTSPGHGLEGGERILVSKYEGDPSYNAHHVVSVVDADTFSIPVGFVDNVDPADPDDPRALWTILDPDNRFQTASFLDAEVTLEIRVDREETNIVFNARSSGVLNTLADGESATDTFGYAVEDSSGAVSFAIVSVTVTGENDDPVPTDDPPGLAVLEPFLTGGASLPETAGDSTVLYSIPVPGAPGTADVAVRPPGAEDGQFVVIPGIDWTDEDTALELASSRFLDNDVEVDESDDLTLAIGAGQESSRLGAAISLNGDASVLTYDPIGAPMLQALAFKERVIDVVTVGVFDGISNVPTTFIVVVEGRNDSPVASNATYTVDERTLLTVSPPGLLDSGDEIDQNVMLPDNRKFLLPQENVGTTIFGARVDYTLAARDGPVSLFASISGDPSSTAVQSAGHGLQTGEEVVLPSSGELTGQYVITQIDDDQFSIPVPFDALYASLGGTWRVLTSTFLYDPRGSVFAGPTGEPSFTLQGLAEDQSYVDTFEYTLLDGSHLFANDDIYRIEVDRTDIELQVLDNDTSLDGVATSRTIVSVGPPSSGGSVSINSPTDPDEDASLIYTPETGFVGDEVFTYTIEDDLGNRDTALVTARVTIDRLNGNLRANPDTFTVATTQSPLLNVLANDSIIPATGAPLTLLAISDDPDQSGTADLEGGQIRYTPSPAAVTFPYTETFSYTMSGGGTATAETTVTVLVVDRRETLNARDDSFGVPAGSSGNTLNVLENDNVLPANGEDFEIITTQNGPADGSVDIVNGDALSYTPNPGFLGTDTFEYTVADGFGGTRTATVSVDVGYIVTNPDIFSIEFDDTTGTDKTTLDVLANDNVLQGGIGGVTITGVVLADPLDVAAADLGTMSKAPDNLSLEFDPAKDAVGQADYIYSVSDGERTSTSLVTVVVISDGIRASSDYFTVQADSSENQLLILSNDLRLSLLPGVLSIGSIGTGVDAPDQGGSVEIIEGPDNTPDYLLYTPAPGFNGTESFTYTVTDGSDSDTARVSIRVTAGAMVAADDDFLVFNGSTGNRLAVLLNDRVIPDSGQLLFVTAVGLDSVNPDNAGLAARGTLVVIEGGAALSYTPSPANIPSNLTSPPSYTETFNYEISSGGTERAEGRITLVVEDRVGVRNLETNDDTFTVRSDSTGTLLPVLANDSVLPATTDDWIITELSPPTVNVCSSFLFVASDFPDPAPFAEALALQGTNLTSYLWTQFSGGSQTLFSNPAADEDDLRDAMASEFNDILQSGMSIYDPTRFGGVTLRASTQYLIDNGATGDELVVLNRLLLEDAFAAEIVRAPGGGTLQTVGSDIIYVPQPGFVGSVRFRYMVSDGLGGTGSAEVVVKVGDVSVSDDAYTVLAGGGPVELDVTANDGVLRTSFPEDPDPAQADFSLTPWEPVTVDPLAAGTAMVVGSRVEFTPDAGFVGIAELTYWVEDDGGCTYPGIARVDVRSPLGDESTAQVSVTVNGVNDEPMLVGADPSATDDTMQTQPFANATVIEHDEQRLQQVTLTISYDPVRGTLAGDFTEISPGVLQFVGTAEQITTALRALVFTPVINRIPVGTTEDTLFSVSMDDGDVADPVVVDTAVTTVTPVNDPPVITGTVSGQKLYQFSTLRPFAGVNITEVDDLGLQPLTITVEIDDPIKGILTNLGGFVEVPAGSGIYVLTGTAATTSAALRAIDFQPTPDGRVTPTESETAGFTISVDDGFAPPVVDAATSVIVLHAEVDQLLALDATTGIDASEASASFGSSVAISGDTLLVGSPLRDASAADDGRAYVYERNAGLGAPWGQVAILSGDDTGAGDQFGFAMAIDGDLLAVGAPLADAGGTTEAGAVYVFHRDPSDPNAWLQVAKLAAPASDSFRGAAFGAGLALQGSTLLVGAPNGNGNRLPGGGRVFAFQQGAGGPGDWALSQTLISSDTIANNRKQDEDLFGTAIAIDGNTAVIGAPGSDLGRLADDWSYGAAYIFDRAGPGMPWSESERVDEFDASALSNFAGFGSSVDISGDRIIVGIFWNGQPESVEFPAGARIFERDHPAPDQWGLVSMISPADGGETENFGAAVAISDDLALIGSPGPTKNSTETRGFVEVYRRGPDATPTWNPIDLFAPSSSDVVDRFGEAVAIDGFTAVVGAGGDSDNAFGAADAGSARVYQFQYDLGPRLTVPIPDRFAEVDMPFSFLVDPITFDDPIYPAELALGVQLTDGSPLPFTGWLSFDSSTGEFSGTPTAGNSTDYELVLFATNPLGSRILSNPFRVTVGPDFDPNIVVPALTVAEAYDYWCGDCFPPEILADPALEATVWGMSANPDGDPHDNLMEMLFGTDPGSFDPSQLAFQKLNATQVELTFPLSSEFPLDAVHVEWSTDVLGWSRDGVELTTVPDGLGDLVATAVVTLPAPEPKLLVRIVAEP